MTSFPRFLVTGAAGFVGSHLAAHFSKSGSVLGVARQWAQAGTRPFTPLAADLVQGLPEAAEFRDATVIHCAAIMRSDSDDELWSGNVDATFRLLDWAHRHRARHFVFLSSGGVYPYARGHRHRESDPVDPLGFYGHTKWIGEVTVRAYHRLHQFPVTVVRLFFPYGPGQSRGIFPFIARTVQEGGTLTIKPDGAPVINPIHIDDVVSAIERIVETPAGHRVYNLCGDEELSFRDAVKLFERKYDCQAVLQFSEERQGDLLGDNELIKTELGWQPRHRLDSIPEAIG